MSAQARPITVTEMRYVRTMRGPLHAPAIAVTREMGRTVKVSFWRFYRRGSDAELFMSRT